MDFFLKNEPIVIEAKMGAGRLGDKQVREASGSQKNTTP
jgi:hypothetical protein